ncbi:MAG: hypothetical protein R3A79_01950 [Nannocystaceae bacterium]
MHATEADWRRLGAIAPDRLAPARLAAHWAVQLLAAAADAHLPRAVDDRHTALHWHDQHFALVGNLLGERLRVGLRLSDLNLLILGEDGGVDDARALVGETLAASLTWLEGHLTRAGLEAAPLRLRAYPMPEHPVAAGAPFPTVDLRALEELGCWYADASLVLEDRAGLDPRSTAIATWPHHFDIAGVIHLAPAPGGARPDAPQIGYGLSPGDRHIAAPYLYVTPSPFAAAALPTLPCGRWHLDGFRGAVLPAAEFILPDYADDHSDEQIARFKGFFDAAITAAEAMLRRDLA